MPTVSGCRYSLRVTLTDLLETYAATRIFIIENGVKFIQSVVILQDNCTSTSKSPNIKFLIWLPAM